MIPPTHGGQGNIRSGISFRAGFARRRRAQRWEREQPERTAQPSGAALGGNFLDTINIDLVEMHVQRLLTSKARDILIELVELEVSISTTLTRAASHRATRYPPRHLERTARD